MTSFAFYRFSGEACTLIPQEIRIGVPVVQFTVTLAHNSKANKLPFCPPQPSCAKLVCRVSNGGTNAPLRRNSTACVP